MRFLFEINSEAKFKFYLYDNDTICVKSAYLFSGYTPGSRIGIDHFLDVLHKK